MSMCDELVPCLGGPLDGQWVPADQGDQFDHIERSSVVNVWERPAIVNRTTYFKHSYEAFGNRVIAYSNHELTPAQEAERLTNHYREEIASWTPHRPGFGHHFQI